MTQFQNYNSVNPQIGTPLYNYPTNVSSTNTVPMQPITVPVQQTGVTPIYQYPTSSVYPQAGGMVASGVNINIYNPMGCSCPAGMEPTSQPVMNPGYYNPSFIPAQPVNQPQVTGPQQVPAAVPPESIQPQPNGGINDGNQPKTISEDDQNNTPAANPIKSEDDKNQSNKLSDEYIKALENNLRNADKDIRKSAIIQIGKRFEEDHSRYKDPALNALLNIALQDPDANNRTLALNPLATGDAGGDDNTKKLVEKCQKSESLYGAEKRLANDALVAMMYDNNGLPQNDNKPKSKDDDEIEE